MRPPKNLIRALFAVYCLLLCAVMWWPLDFAAPYPNKPYYVGAYEPTFVHHRGRFEDDTLKVAMFIPVGIFLLLLPGTQRSRGGTVIRAVLWGLALISLLQVGRYFLPRHFADLDDVVINTSGVLLGAGIIYFQCLSRRSVAWLTALCVFCFVVAATWPMHFSLQAASRSALAARVEWSPFSGRFDLSTLRERALNGLMMMPLGLLAVTYAIRTRPERQALFYATMVGFCSSVSVELLQCFLPHRTPSLSDISLNTLGTFAGAFVAVYLERWNVTRFQGPVDTAIEERK